jgi:hypothetical protein
MFERAADIDQAIDEVALLASSLPGDFDVGATDYDDLTIVTVRGRLIPSGCDVEIDLRLVETVHGVDVPEYRVSVRRNGRLLWRADRHSGHESDPAMRGRSEHRHVRVRGAERRVPDTPQTLESIRRQIVATNIEQSEASA